MRYSTGWINQELGPVVAPQSRTYEWKRRLRDYANIEGRSSRFSKHSVESMENQQEPHRLNMARALENITGTVHGPAEEMRYEW